MADAKIGDVFEPGQKVPRSGIYLVTHDSQHAKAHEVTCVYGKTFPPCNHCGKHPRFKAVKFAIHIDSDENFKK